MIAAVVLGPLLHWLEILLACLGISAAITAGLVVRRRWREHQALTQGRYVPWLQPPSNALRCRRRNSLNSRAASTCTCTWVA
jgi:hypothetical protein